MEDKNVALANADYVLGMVRLARDDVLSGDPARRLPGISNLATWGRAVTSALHRLKTAVPDYEEWYGPKRDEMERDELCRYFYELRTNVLKRAEPPKVNVGARIGYLDSSMIAELQKHAPPGAVGTFIGDSVGGSGWEVKLPDGSVEKVYAKLPPEWDVEVSVTLHNSPKSHRGAALADGDIEQCARLYYQYLAALVAEAHARWD